MHLVQVISAKSHPIERPSTARPSAEMSFRSALPGIEKRVPDCSRHACDHLAAAGFEWVVIRNIPEKARLDEITAAGNGPAQRRRPRGAPIATAMAATVRCSAWIACSLINFFSTCFLQPSFNWFQVFLVELAKLQI